MRYLLLLTIFASLALAEIKLPTSFKATFKQTITNPKKKKITYHGTLAFSKQHGLKWLYTKPTKKDVCSDKVRLVVVDHDLEQVAYYQLNKAIDLEKIVQKAHFIKKGVYTAKYDDNYYTMQVSDKGELQRIAYKDDVDNDGLIIFSNMRYSTKELSKSKLECKVPKGYDQIDG